MNSMRESCNACGGTLTSRFSRVRDPITKESFGILACTKCGLGHTHPHPPDLSPYYGRYYYGGRHGITAKFCIRHRLRLLENAIENATQKRLLDIGCGDGSFLLAAKEAGWNVTGTEINPHPARAFNLDIRHTLDEIEDPEQFECVTMWHSLEHMKDIKSILHLIAKRLTPRGRLIIAVPNNDSLQAKLFGPGWLPLDVPRHLYHFNPGSLRFSLENAGFHVYRSGQHEIEYDLLGWSQSALNYLNRTPNIFFDILSGKGKHHSVWARTSNFILGPILTLASTVALPVEALMGRSGTFVMTACRKV
ncbi:MAG: class I SAM-dependent methyltransferase [Nitrospina sp.]|jgi:SAM-dependent methyltransferase|nr:class I SAM-dependent methyltransferase [Nitrospina sp.]